MEAVAVDWEKLGLKAKRVPESFGNFLPKIRARQIGRTFWVFAAPPFDERGLGWQLTIWTAGAFNLRGEAVRQRRGREPERNRSREAGQADPRSRAEAGYHGVMRGMKSTTWAVTKKVGGWHALVSVPLENDYEYRAAAER